MQVGHELYGFEPEEEMSCQPSDLRFSGLCKGAFILAAVLTFATGCGKKQVVSAGGPPEVEVAAVVQQDVTLYTECI